MARNAEEYRKLFQSLLPQGRIWTRSKDGILTQLLYAEADEFSRIDESMDALVDETRTATISESLTDWEKDFDLPDPGRELEPTIAGRIEVVLAKLIAVGQQDKGYFEDIATALGYNITIVEHKPFWAGIGAAGDPCGDQNNLFYWHVYINIPDDPNDLKWNISQLIFEITRLKPGHTMVLFDFYGAGYSRGFSRGFNSIREYDGSWWPGSFGSEFSDDYANAYGYDGVNFIGAFSQAFSLAFDRHTGGGFNFDNFSNAFSKPI